MTTETNFSQYLNDLQEKKQQLLSLAGKAAEYGWIPKTKFAETNKDNTVISLEEIKDKLEKDTLTIGVIGQMKCGKSTFLNSFVFEDNVLPAATTPMTAALSVITYGEKERIVAEFYTADEWAEQKQQASRSLEDVANPLEESKVKAAKELVEKSAKLGSSLNNYLGKTQDDRLDNLIEYVGADGKYISITKSVTIYYPKEYLRGVEIVDTPGFNDPIVSREERTKEFLKKADVVLMMLYAGRPFDATDRDIIFKNVRQCGIGKVLVGINKYDIPYCSETNPEDENQIKEYVKSEIRKACRDCNDNTLVEILSEVEPIPLSAEMALLSELPMTKICETEAFDFAWKRHCSNFDIGTQQEMRKWSHLDNLVNAVKEMVDKEKGRILFAKPLNAIIAAGDKLKGVNENELSLLTSKIDLLKMPDDEIDEKEENLNKANRRITKKINSLGDDIDSEFDNLVRKGKQELEDLADESYKKIKSIVENDWGRFKSFDSIAPRVNGELQNLVTRKLKRATENIADTGKRKIDQCVSDFFADAEELLMKFLPDFDSRDFVKSIKKSIKVDIDNCDLFSIGDDSSDMGDDDSNLLDICGEMVYEFMNGAMFGGLDVVMNAINHDEIKFNVLNEINKMQGQFDPEPYLQNAFNRKDQIINDVKKKFIYELINPLQEQIEEIRTKKGKKEGELKSSEAKKAELENRKKQILSQIEEISAMKASIA